MNYSALIPVKSLASAKSRLAASLTLHQREHLVLDMLRHVIRTLQASAAFEQVFVVSADPYVLEQARAWDAFPLREEQAGHNAALHMAALRIMSLKRPEQVRTRYADEGLLTISADLPLLSVDDLHGMLEQGRYSQVVLASSHEETGTNAVLMRPPLALPYVFGPDSLYAYVEAAQEEPLSYTIYRSRGLALDIDTPGDLFVLPGGEAAWRVGASCAG